MKVIDYFSEATWGGWTMVIWGTDVIGIGDMVYDKTRINEFVVKDVIEVALDQKDGNTFLIWLSPNYEVPTVFDIDDELIIRKKK